METMFHDFATFPKFSRLTLADKERYRSLVSTYPPYADLSFNGLMIWWDVLSSCAVSQINNNLVISYWMPGDEKNSGLSIIGTDRIDESVTSIIDYLKQKNEPACLVHVPELTVSNMQYPELYTFDTEPDYDEWIFSVSSFYPLSHGKKRFRNRINRLLSRIDERRFTAKTLDLRLKSNQKLLIEAEDRWFQRGGFNDLAEIDREAFRLAVRQAPTLDIDNICLFIDGKLVAFQLYELPADRRYVIATFVKLDESIPGLAEYMFYTSARHFKEQDITYINFEQDLGLPRLRAEKIALGPINFLRKYTIGPRL